MKRLTTQTIKNVQRTEYNISKCNGKMNQHFLEWSHCMWNVIADWLLLLFFLFYCVLVYICFFIHYNKKKLSLLGNFEQIKFTGKKSKNQPEKMEIGNAYCRWGFVQDISTKSKAVKYGSCCSIQHYMYNNNIF